MSFITINLKLFKPSKKKSMILELAMENYSRAFDYILQKALSDAVLQEKIINKENIQFEIARWIRGEISKELNTFQIQPFKDSIIKDFAMFFSGYLSLKKTMPDTPKPLVYVDEKALNDTFHRYLYDISNNDDPFLSDSSMEKLIEKEGKLRPIYFCRNDRFRDFCLLYDENSMRYFVKIYLLNHKDSLKRTEEANLRQLKYVHKAGGVLASTEKRERFIISPLAFGKFQENYLKQALLDPSIIKTARLKKNNKDFYLSISLEIKENKLEKTEHYLSICRGIKKHLNYAVVDMRGIVVEKGSLIEDCEFNEKNMQTILYQTAKKICDLSIKYRCEILAEALDKWSDFLNFKDKDGSVYRTAFKKSYYFELIRILKYKLVLYKAGKLLELSPLDIFYRCPDCNTLSKRNRFKKDIFLCSSCGSLMDIDELGSVNLARKLLKYNKSRIIIKSVQVENGIIFKNQMLGFEYFWEFSNGDYLEQIINKINEILNNTDFNTISKKQQSLILKLRSTNELTKIIMIV